MMALLKAHPAKIDVYIDGLAASAASLIAMAGDTIEISQGGMMMIHNPASYAPEMFGEAEDHRRAAEDRLRSAALLDKVRDTLAETYANRSSLTVQEASDFMAAETWFNAEECLGKKLVDRIGAEMAMAACVDIGCLKFKHAPAQLLAKGGEPVTLAPPASQRIDDLLKFSRTIPESAR